MLQRALVVLENELVSSPALDYARQVARRMDAEVTLLMLVEMGFSGDARLGVRRNAISGLEERAGNLLSELVAGFVREGITTSAALRLGDPGAELLKFLAERPPYQMIIWGSGERLPGRRRGHWIRKAARSLECPLWTVGSRAPE